MNILKEKISAIVSVHHAFADIVLQPNCSTCACFHADTMAEIYAVIEELRGLSDDEHLLQAENDFSSWLEAARHKTMHQ